MANLREWLYLARPTGSEKAFLSARATKPNRYVPPLQILLGILRRFWPIPNLFGWAVVTLRDDVEEVLTRADIFHTPFADEMARLIDGKAPGTQFLAMDNLSAHDEQAKKVMAAFTLCDLKEQVIGIASQRASAIVRNAANSHRLEAIGGLITRVPLDISIGYYGIPTEDPVRFAHAFMDVSGHLFGLPPITPKLSVDRSAAYVRGVIDAAIAAEQKSPSGNKTVIAALVAKCNRNEISVSEVRAFLFGMVLGFVPTDTMAGGHILDVLLDKPAFLASARAAAEQGDDTLLARCLFEALRFMPINFGPFRICGEDYTVAAGTPRATRIRAGTKMLASTMSAMFDASKVDQPFSFMPGRSASDLMHFGFGMHWCIGAFIAQTQITQTFKPLLLRPGLRRAPGPDGQLARYNGFPDRLVVVFE